MINLELEKSVLSCLLIDNSLIETARKELSDKDFHNSIYTTLFNEILEKRSVAGYADLTNLKSVAIETLVEINSFTPTISRFKSYIKELKELSTKRTFARQIEKLKTTVSTDSLEEIKTNALKLISNIRIEEYIDEKTDITSILCDAMTKLEEQHNNCGRHYPKWGLTWFDLKTGGVKPGLTYLAARPSVGKTAFALQLALNVAKQGLRTAIFSLEMDKVSLCNRLICNHGNIKKDYFDRATCVPDDAWKQIALTSAIVSKLPINIYDKAFTIEEILLLAQEQKENIGLDFLVIDYIQLCETSHKCNNPNERISYISRQLKKFQQQTGIHVLALSQLNRESEQNQFPKLSSLRDSGSLEQDANMVIFLHEEGKPAEQNQSDKKEIMFVIAKQREGERNIYTTLNFYGATQRFY